MTTTAIPLVHASIGTIPYTVNLSDGRHQWLGDEPTELGGADAGPSPMHLLLSSLGACTAATLTMYAQRKQWPLTGINIVLALNPDGVPAAGQSLISRDISLLGDLSVEQQQRLLQIANACPVHKIITGNIAITSTLAQPL